MRLQLKTFVTMGFACLFSVEFLIASQTVGGWYWLAPVGFVPLVLFLEPTRFGATWVSLGVVAGLQAAGSMVWVAMSGSNFGLFLPVIAVYAALPFAAAAAVCRAASTTSQPEGGLLALPAAWALAELLTRRTGLCVSWTLAGMPLADLPLLSQGAALGGPEALSFLVVAMGVAIALPFRKCQRRVFRLGTAQGVVSLVAALVWGAASLGGGKPDGPLIRAALIQPNVSQDHKWDPAYRQETLAHIDGMIDRVLDRDPDLIVLPETAVTGFVRYEKDLTDWVRSVVTRTARPLLFGSLDRDGDPPRYFNVAVMISPYNTVTTYRKIRLVPVTEQVPRVGLLKRCFVAFRESGEEFTPGQERTQFELRGRARFATVICYEDIFPELISDFAREGAGAIFALVNTERFKGTSQGLQHLRRARLTAISAGVPLIRCTNSGISCVIDVNGRVVDRIDDGDGSLPGVEGARVFSVLVAPVQTLYRRFGDLLLLGTLAAIATGSIASTHLVATSGTAVRVEDPS